MPRYYNFKKRYIKYRKSFFILDWFVNRIMKNGKKLTAIKQLKKCLAFISKTEKKNSYKFLLTVLYMVGPRIECYSIPSTEGQIEYIEDTLNFIGAAKHAINILLKNSDKRRENKFYKRLASEIIDSYYGKSASIKEKESIENENIKKITEQAELQAELEEELDEIEKENTFKKKKLKKIRN